MAFTLEYQAWMLWKEKREKALALKHINKNYTSAFTNNRANKTFLLLTGPWVCGAATAWFTGTYNGSRWLQHQDGMNAGGYHWTLSSGQGRNLWHKPELAHKLHMWNSGFPGYQASNKCSQTPKQVQQCGRENDIFLNLLLFRVGGVRVCEGGGSVRLSNSLMVKWQIPWGGMVDLDGRETACPQTYTESIAGASPSWHTWQK